MDWHLWDDPEQWRRALRLSVLHPGRFLAAPLAPLTDEAMAAEIGADPGAVWRLRLAPRPRAASWRDDVQRLALALDANRHALEALLRRVGVHP